MTTILFGVLVFFLTRQVPFNNYSFIMNLAIILFFILNFSYIRISIKNSKSTNLLIYYILITISMMILYSIFLGNEVFLVLRFSLITILIIFAYFIKPNRIYISMFLFFICIQSIFLIGFETYLISNFTLENYTPIREFFNENSWGDVYTYDGRLWKIQLLGNGLIPFAFFISLIYFKSWKKYVLSFLFFIATIVAGNFAFILGILFFLCLYLVYIVKWTISKIIIVFFSIFILFAIFGPQSIEYLNDIVERKSIESNPIRIEQANILINDLNKNPMNLIFGKGMGHTLDVRTQWRDYTGNIYFELQSLYFLNQMGFFIFFIFVILNILWSFYKIKYKILLITYISYIFYSFFNPYFLDTSHIIVIIILVSLRKVLDENLFNSRGI